MIQSTNYFRVCVIESLYYIIIKLLYAKILAIVQSLQTCKFQFPASVRFQNLPPIGIGQVLQLPEALSPFLNQAMWRGRGFISGGEPKPAKKQETGSTRLRVKRGAAFRGTAALPLL